MTIIYILLAAFLIYQAYMYGKFVGEREATPTTAPSIAYVFKVDIVKDIWYAYSMENQFLGQAESAEAVTQVVRNKVPGHKFYIAVEKT